jgi:hypothetical protein
MSYNTNGSLRVLPRDPRHVHNGSLRVLPRDPRHVHGSGNDGVTTIYGKAVAMSSGIDIRSPAASSMARHRRQRRAVLAILGIVAACVALGAVRWMVRSI